MKMKSALPLLVIAAGVAANHSAQASVVYDNGPPNVDNGYHSGAENQSGSIASVPAITFNGMNWWGLWHGTPTPGTDTFTLSIYNDVSNAYGSLVTSTSLGFGSPELTGQPLEEGSQYAFSAQFSPITLAAGSYFFVVNDTSNAQDWSWQDTSGGLGGESRGGQSFPYDSAENMAFQLTETAPVPLPAAAWLMLSGLGGLAGLMRRRATS